MTVSSYFLQFIATVSAFWLALVEPALAQEDYGTQPAILRPGLTHSTKGRGMICPNGSYLSGLAMKLTNRVTGVFLKCQSATWNGLWTAEQPLSMHVAGDATPYDIESNCPQNSFITGLAYVTGEYSGGGIQAKPDIGRLIADLRPACRVQLGTPLLLNRNPLTGAQDNDLREVPWQESSQQNCPRGYAAVGVAIDFVYRRDLDPNNRFHDVALYCRRLTVGLRPGIDKVITSF